MWLWHQVFLCMRLLEESGQTRREGMKNLDLWVWLTSIAGLGSIKITKLIETFGNPENIWDLKGEDYISCGFLNKNDVEQILKKDLKVAREIINTCKSLNIDIITISDSKYPNRLKQIPDPPYVLYSIGKIPDDILPHVGIVGSRKGTYYGRSLAVEFAFQLSREGVVIVSGMARGIDTCAHKGALKAGGITAAVLGCGVDIPYPKENMEIMKYIAKSGVILSEYPPGTHPVSGNFPARNRIISGLCDIILVIEAGVRSGALITADFALEQGREVMAIPGNIDSFYSKGTNNLIKQGAKPVSCIDDVLEELRVYAAVSPNNDKYVDETMLENNGGVQKYDLTDNESKIMNCLSKTPLHIDSLCRSTGCSIKELNSILTMLELRGLVTQLPGKQFVKR